MKDIKKNILFRDRMINYLSADDFYRLSIVKTTQTIKDAAESHQLNSLEQFFLGQFLTLNLLATNQLKSEERISIELKSSGKLRLIQTEANALGEVRGYIALEDPAQDFHHAQSFSEFIGNGTLSVNKILYGQARPFTGIVELQVAGLIPSMTNYYIMSEQIPSAIKVDLEYDQNGKFINAVGLLIQQMPIAENILEKQTKDSENPQTFIENKLSTMPNLCSLLANDIYLDTIVEYVWPEKVFREISRRNVDFFCRCSRDKMAEHLKLLPKTDLQEMAEDETTKIKCHYCGREYYFSSYEIRSLT